MEQKYVLEKSPPNNIYHPRIYTGAKHDELGKCLSLLS
jgi:hypothetical protein